MTPLKIKLGFLLLLGSLALMNCRESASGCCKDSFATNFDPMAEENTCCTYPEIDMDIFHKIPLGSNCFDLVSVDKIPMNFDTTSTDSFEILQSSWFIRELQLFDGADWLDLSEEVEIPLPDSMFQTYPKNFAVNDFDLYRIPSVGSSNLVGVIEGIRLTMGWAGIGIDTTEERINTITDLARAKALDLIDDNGNILIGRIRLIRPTDDTISLAINGDDLMKNHSFGSTIELSRGFDRRLELTLDYSKLFQNIDLSGDVSSIESVLYSNLENHDDVIQIDTIY